MCKHKGIEAYCESVSGYAARNPDAQVDFIVSFHCLEHVPDPVGFVSQFLRLVRPGGYIMISTPLSPMSFEGNWFDPLNHPPHHMTRWTEKAYRQMAVKLGCQSLILRSAPLANPLLRVMFSTYLTVHLAPPAPGRLKLITTAVRHPRHFLRELLGQIRSDKPKDAIAGDTVLAIFQKPALGGVTSQA